MRFFVLILMFASNAFAGGVGITGGGHGVVSSSGAVYLLDLYEHGNQITSPTFNLGSFFIAPVGLPDIAGLDQASLLGKLNDIATIDPVLAVALYETITQINWRLIDEELVAVDPETSIKTKIVQLGVRNETDVLIARPYFSKMDAANQVAFVIHEAVAALADEKLASLLTPRVVTSKLFDLNFYAKPAARQQLDLNYFPSLDGIIPYIHPNEMLDASGILMASDGTTDGFKLVPQIRYQYMNKSRFGEITPEISVVRPETLDYTVQRLRGICDEKDSDRGLLSVAVDYATIEVQPTRDMDEGHPLPRFQIQAGYGISETIPFGSFIDGRLANCSPETKRDVEALATWLSTFKKANPKL